MLSSFIILLIKYWHYFFLNFIFFISFYFLSPHQHIILNAIHAQCTTHVIFMLCHIVSFCLVIINIGGDEIVYFGIHFYFFFTLHALVRSRCTREHSICAALKAREMLVWIRDEQGKFKNSYLSWCLAYIDYHFNLICFLKFENWIGDGRKIIWMGNSTTVFIVDFSHHRFDEIENKKLTIFLHFLFFFLYLFLRNFLCCRWWSTCLFLWIW